MFVLDSLNNIPPNNFEVFLVGLYNGLKVTDIVTSIAIIIGTYVAIRVYLVLSPQLNLTIITRVYKINYTSKKLIIISLEIENISKVRAKYPITKLQILQANTDAELSDFIPFERVHITPRKFFKKRKVEDLHNFIEKYRSFQNAMCVFGGTTDIDPGESINCDYKYIAPNNSIVHIGLQTKIKRKWYEFLKNDNLKDSWTTTKILKI